MHRLLIPCVALIAICLPAAAAPPDPADPNFNPAEYGLAPDPLVNERFGLTMYYPAGADVTPTVVGPNTILEIKEGGDQPGWSVNIQQMVMRALDDPSAAGVAARLQRELQYGGDDVEILTNRPRMLGDREGHELWATKEGVVVAFLIAETGMDRYVVFRIAGAADDYDRIRAILDPALATVELMNVAEMDRQRELEFERAEQALATLTESRLRSLTGTSQWYRIYVPSATGDWMQDREMGYLRLTIDEAQRGRVNPERDPDQYKAGEKEVGLLIAVDARYLEKPADAGNPAIYADFQVRMWQAWDRSKEVWVSRVTFRQGDASRSESEIGTREAPNLGFSKLLVAKNSLERRQHHTMEWVITEPYISLGEVYMLGALLPRDGSVTGTMRFHAYDPLHQSQESLPVRIDTWQPASDGSGNWVHISRPTPEMPSVTSTFDRDGQLVRREKPGGILSEPIDREQLLQIWRRKGLPTGG